MTLYGILDIDVWQGVLAAFVLTHVTIAAVTIYLHRSQAHRALDVHPIVAHFFRAWLWLTTGMVTRQWVAVHRRHHARCETPLDPHSPQVLGLSKVLTQGAELYAAAAGDPDTLERFGKGQTDDWLERNLYSRFHWQGTIVMLLIDILLFGVYGIVIWAVQMIWIPFWAAGVVNGVGHYAGYRNFESPDASTNFSPWGILIGGEELHNNHHAFPSSARLSSKWWEFDLGWLYIRLLALLRLARVRHLAPEPKVIPGKQTLDMDTLAAVIRSRMHVIADYGREVLAPVARAELCRDAGHCRRLARRWQKLLTKEADRLDAVARQRVEQLLAQHQRLATVYHFREQLQEVWERRAPTQEALLKMLQDWCQRAESTGIQALENFARSLRGYSLQAAHGL